MKTIRKEAAKPKPSGAGVIKGFLVKEFDVVALKQESEGTHTKKGDVGTILDVIGDGKLCIVEFGLQTGCTAALEGIEFSTLRPLAVGELGQERYKEWKAGVDRRFGLLSAN